ncbi:MAG: hypothetical protein R2839_11420 [Thermomicrobiales bacterium]
MRDSADTCITICNAGKPRSDGYCRTGDSIVVAPSPDPF